MLATVQTYATVSGGDQSAATQGVAEVADGLACLGVDGGYVNYIEPALPHWGRAYYGDSLDRLRDVANRYDPGRVWASRRVLATLIPPPRARSPVLSADRPGRIKNAGA